MTAARQAWWDTQDPRDAMKNFPRSAYIERNILSGLCERETDYMGALNKVCSLVDQHFPAGEYVTF